MDTAQKIENKNLNKPLTIKSFSIENDAGGLMQRFSEPELFGDIEPLVGKTFNYESVEAVLKNVLQKRAESGVYEELTAKIEPFDHLKIDYSNDEKYDSSLKIIIKKIPKLFANFKTDINSNQDICTGGQVGTFDFFNQRERITFNLEKSLKGATDFNLTAQKKMKSDRVRGLPIDFDLSASFFRSSVDKSWICGVNEELSGIDITASNEAKTNSLIYSLVLRKNYASPPKLDAIDPSLLCDLLSPSIKSSIKLNYTHRDSCDSVSFPTAGDFLKTSWEFAGLGGNVSFIKFSIKNGIFRKIANWDKFSLGLTTNFGIIVYPQFLRNALNAQETCHINDRFFLGGVNSFIGYKNDFLGPVSPLKNALGGNFLFSSVLCLSFPIRIKSMESLNLRGSLFACIGNLFNFEFGGAKEVVQKMKDLKVSVGLGVDLPIESHGVSLRACVSSVINAKDGEPVARFQTGIGVRY